MAKETKIRRVKAKDSPQKVETMPKSDKPKISKYAAKVNGIEIKEKKRRFNIKMPKFIKIIFSPLTNLLRYIKESWQELKLVRWPTRKETWKMTSAVIIFSAAFTALVLVADGFFTWIFKIILGK